MNRSFSLLDRSFLGILSALALGCTESPSGPVGTEVAGFEIRKSNGALLYSWDGSVGASDTVRLAAHQTIPVQFRWLDSSGEQVTVSPSSVDMTVSMSSPGIARWVPHASDPSMGSFVTGALLQPLPTAFSVELELRGSRVIDTSLIPMKVSP